MNSLFKNISAFVLLCILTSCSSLYVPPLQPDEDDRQDAGIEEKDADSIFIPSPENNTQPNNNTHSQTNNSLNNTQQNSNNSTNQTNNNSQTSGNNNTQQGCGNNTVEQGETCDPIASCPTACDDNNRCTTDNLAGDPNQCTAVCNHEPVTACTSGDGCCPPNCNENDSDCTPDCSSTDSWPDEWKAFEAEAFRLVNIERQKGANCGGQNMPAVPPVTANEELNYASRCHSQDMGDKNYFDHTGADGSNFSQRAKRVGFTGSPVNENIAAGQASPQSAVSGWMKSPGHCRNIMSGSATMFGYGYILDNGSQWKRYWTMVGGR